MSSTLLLALSVLVLMAGPAVLAVSERYRWLIPAIDGFVLIAVGGMVLGEVLPGAYGIAGVWVLVAAVAGLIGPPLLERLLVRSARKVHMAALLIAVAGLAIHAMTDGVVLSNHSPIGSEQGSLGIAIVLHRLPVGLIIWWLVRPAHGWQAAACALFALAAATVAGFIVGGALTSAMSSASGALLHGFVGGALLHVVLHGPHTSIIEEQATARRVASVLGALAAVPLLWMHFGPQHHGHSASHTWEVLLSLLFESAPALLVAYIGAGLLHSFMPKATIAWMGRGNALQQATRGVAFGLPLPLCSCGVVPVYSGLIRRGVPTAAAMAFFVATPELGIDAVLLSIPLLGAEMTVARVVAAVVVAVLVGWVIGGRVSTRPSGDDFDDLFGRTGTTTYDRLKSAARVGLGEVVDKTAPWIVLGLVVAAVLQPMLQDSALVQLPGVIQVPLFGLLGMPAYVCAAGATPLVAILLAAGVSPGAGLAFLLTGPATNVTTFGLLKDLHGRTAALGFAGLVAISAIALGYIVNLALPELVLPTLQAGVGHQHSAVGSSLEPQHIAALVLCLLFFASLLRQGPRGFIGQAISLEHPGHSDRAQSQGHHCHDDEPVDGDGSGQPSEEAEEEPAPCCH